MTMSNVASQYLRVLNSDWSDNELIIFRMISEKAVRNDDILLSYKSTVHLLNMHSYNHRFLSPNNVDFIVYNSGCQLIVKNS